MSVIPVFEKDSPTYRIQHGAQIPQKAYSVPIHQGEQKEPDHAPLPNILCISIRTLPLIFFHPF